jgi:uncharacterized membrane protein YhaH (DUF805 family)
MGFTEAIRTCMREKYATFSGRAARSEYWYFTLFYLLVLIGMGVILGGLGSVTSPENGGMTAGLTVLIALMVVFALGTILPMISLQVRRLHDRDLSGWWYLAYVVLGAVPFVGVIATIVLFVVFALRGTPGPNRFGVDPLGADAGAAAIS